MRLLVPASAARSALGPRACLAANVSAETGATVRVVGLVGSAGGGGGDARNPSPLPLPATATEADVILSVEGAPRAVAAAVRLVAALLRGASSPCSPGSTPTAASTFQPAASAAASGIAAPLPPSPHSPASAAGPGPASQRGSPHPPSPTAWGHPALPRLQLKPSRLGGKGGWEAAAASAAASTTTSTLLPLTPTQAAVLLAREGLALAQVRAVTGALAAGEGCGGAATTLQPTHSPSLRLTGTPAQVAGAVAMVQALLMAAGVEAGGAHGGVGGVAAVAV